MHGPFLDRVKQVRAASSEDRVRELLGEPIAVYEAGDSIDWDVEYSMYGHPRKWTIEKRVLVFLGPTQHVPSDYIMFVHMGRDGRVKETYVGGT
jgi:outer membrane protein assembly factor BamE (lipoprotein component of BamABCDE complex)